MNQAIQILDLCSYNKQARCISIELIVSGLIVTFTLTDIVANDLEQYWSDYQFDIEEALIEYFENNPELWGNTEISLPQAQLFKML